MTLRSLNVEKLADVWSQYVEHRRSQVAPSTVARDYLKITRRLETMQLDAPNLATGDEVRDFLLDRYSHETTRRTIQQLQAASRWAVFQGWFPSNPFEGVMRYLPSVRPSATAWAAFSVTERDRIIATFESHDAFYAPWVKFGFWTGARPEESHALRWKHVANDFSEVLITEACPIDVGITQRTKNYLATRFPCNKRLRKLLQSLKPFPCDRNEFVFHGVESPRLNYHNFQTRHWKPLVEGLADEGLLAFYLPQYNMRHSFITEALKHMEVKDVSYLCRVSVPVLLKHYASRSREITVPEF
ncbi:MAG: site-specific integrase [Cyanobacteria bacterium J06560_5]